LDRIWAIFSLHTTYEYCKRFRILNNDQQSRFDDMVLMKSPKSLIHDSPFHYTNSDDQTKQKLQPVSLRSYAITGKVTQDYVSVDFPDCVL
jgi:hypothetical protein